MRETALLILGIFIMNITFAQQDNTSRETLITEKKTRNSGKTKADSSNYEKIIVKVNWDQVIRISESSATLQVIPNPAHERNSPLHNPLWNALRDLRADYVRYSPWGEYPGLKIAALKPPTEEKTSWDFSALDPMFTDFINAIGDRPYIMNYQAIPEWMLINPKPEKLTHEIGSLFRDPTGKEVAGYFARIVEWYSKGGFRDELGKWHHSGHNYRVGHWEVLNEPDHESIGLTKELYAKLYDAVVEEIRKVAPEMKFMGLSMANLPLAPEWTTYFLDHNNHKPGIPLDMVSYHMYATLSADKNDPGQYPYTVFEQADSHLETIRITDSIRRRLSPQTRVDINESGILFKNVPRGWGMMDGASIPDAFWNLSAAYYAYIYAGLADQGIAIIGKSTLWSDPKDWPEVSLLDWKTGKPNARYRVLKLIRENFRPGDKLIGTDVERIDGKYPVFARGFITPDGNQKILLVNKTNRTYHVSVSGTQNGRAEFVDQTTSFEPTSIIDLKHGSLLLRGFGVTVVTLSR